MTDRPLGYSIRKAAEHLGGVSRATVYRLVQRGDLELVKVGARSVITARSVDALLKVAA